MITKTDLEQIAIVLAETCPYLPPEPKRSAYKTLMDFNVKWLEWDAVEKKYQYWRLVTERFATMLEVNNPNFKKTKFYNACGYGHSGVKDE